MKEGRKEGRKVMKKGRKVMKEGRKEIPSSVTPLTTNGSFFMISTALSAASRS
jgi:hypothetical protein